jgi:hypothetical protein
MTLNLTAEEFRSLLKVVFLGNWMANAYREKPDPEFDNIEQLIMSQASSFGAEECVAYNAGKQGWSYTREYEEEMQVFVDEYNVEALYDELGYWLSRRDLISEIGEDRAEGMTPAGLSDAAGPYLEKYNREFEEFGIERIGIIDDVDEP